MKQHVEAVRTDGAPSRTGLVRDYMRIECPQCWTAYRLHHDGLETKLLRGYFLQTNWQISGERPKSLSWSPLRQWFERNRRRRRPQELAMPSSRA